MISLNYGQNLLLYELFQDMLQIMKYGIINKALLHLDTGESRTCLRTRKLILQKAYTMIAFKGFFKASMVELADSASITRRTLYNYYDNLNDIFKAVHPLILNQMQTNIEERLNDENISISTVERFFSEIFQCLTSDKELFAFVLQSELFLISQQTNIPVERKFKDQIKDCLLEKCDLQNYNDTQVDQLIETFLCYLQTEFLEPKKTREEYRNSYQEFFKTIPETILGQTEAV